MSCLDDEFAGAVTICRIFIVCFLLTRLTRLTSQLVDLMHSCWWARERTVQQIRDLLANSTLWIVLVTPDAGKVVAFARVLTDWVARAFLEDVVVAESLRGQGVGRRLLEALKGHARLRGVEQVALDTSNALATAFYGPAGWGFSPPDTAPNGSAYGMWYPAGHPPVWHAYHPK